MRIQTSSFVPAARFPVIPNALQKRAPGVEAAAKPVDVFELPKAKSAKENIGWLTRNTTGNDQTANFENLYAQVKRGQSVLPSDAKDNVYVTVQGLFGKHYPGYMGENERALKAQGLTVKSAPVNTDVGIEENAKALRDFVMKQEKPVVLIGHSMGGLDITAALSLYPELKDRVRAVVTLQTPHGGTPIASDLQNDSNSKKLVDDVLENVLHGDTKAMSDLSYEARQKFLAAHPYPAGIPTVTLGSSVERKVSLVGVGRDYMKAKYGIPSDGMVPEADSYLPGAKWIRLTGMDHAGAGMADPFKLQSHSAGALTVAAVAVALQR